MCVVYVLYYMLQVYCDWPACAGCVLLCMSCMCRMCVVVGLQVLDVCYCARLVCTLCFVIYLVFHVLPSVRTEFASCTGFYSICFISFFVGRYVGLKL